MCRDNDHGGRRCPNDNSDARRRRRKAAAVKVDYKPIKPANGALIELPPETPLKSIKAIKAEAEQLRELLHQPPLEDQNEQDKIDSALEERVTRLGIAMGVMAEKKAGWKLEEHKKEWDYFSPDFEKVSDELTAARSEETQIHRQIVRLEVKMDTLGAHGEGYQEMEEELKELNIIKAAAKEREKAAQAAWDIEDKKDDERRKKLVADDQERLRSAYISMIAAVRPLGGEVKHGQSDDEAVELITETVGKNYPSAWIEASNQADDDMRIKISEGRPHYNEEAIQHEVTEGGVEQPSSYLFMPIPVNKIEQIHSSLSESPGFIQVQAARPFKNNDENTKVVTMQERKIFNPETDKMGEDGKPEGNNWHYGHTINESASTADEIVNKSKQWYQLGFEQQVRKPELVIADRNNEIHRDIAYHEFVHRAEKTVGDQVIMRQEEAFLRRRTTDKETGQREELTYIFGSMSDGGVQNMEVARKDNFITHYMGKEYLTTYSREALSVGTEAVFGGSYGMFAGIKHNKVDSDHRGFVLGIFASA